MSCVVPQGSVFGHILFIMYIKDNNNKKIHLAYLISNTLQITLTDTPSSPENTLLSSKTSKDQKTSKTGKVH